MRPKDPKKINKMGLYTYVDSFWGLKEITSSKSNKIIMIVCGRIWLDLGSRPRLERFFSGYSGSPSPQKATFSQILIPSGTHGHVSTSSQELLGASTVKKQQQQQQQQQKKKQKMFL